VVVLADARSAARAAREFGEADRLRLEIEAFGWDVRDAGDGYELVPRA
jgi:cysteinyl-tRNA synthetase